MNIAELYDQVAQLGFERALEDVNRFYLTLNRALLQVAKVRPTIKPYIINHKPLENLIKQESFTPIDKESELVFEAENAKSFYFEADGFGIVYIERYVPKSKNIVVHDSEELENQWVCIGHVELESPHGGFVPYKGLIKDHLGKCVQGLIRMRFSGEYLYSVRNIALYKHLLSGDAKDVPAYEPYTRYDLSTLCSDFLEIYAPPIQEGLPQEVLAKNFDIEGGKVVLLSRERKGVYKILYIHKPNAVMQDREIEVDDRIIDLDEELCALLPNLIAAYVWMEDEPTRSEYYMNLYKERAAEIEYKNKINKPITIRNINGW